MISGQLFQRNFFIKNWSKIEQNYKETTKQNLYIGLRKEIKNMMLHSDSDTL